ncbi:MAG: hypothetical protein KA099_01390 [Alphaproteobacteria bacterium]|nr:hypothetical protein [Alphaproteobacteria bacterium]MBP7758682.1 hypothetical protein [Alphaproteobacteria bacterium]MBP7761710.1 hypothetical protein [Alphaproteobacteria bacterium]MBP7903955.1 hypothetical protein [Alphaproteobacteria bacterium]
MSDVNSGDSRLIYGPEDVSSLYTGVGDQAKAGVEVELAFFDRVSQKPIGVAQNNMLKDMAHDALGSGVWVHNEPTSETVEVSSMAAPLDSLRSVMDDLRTKMAVVADVAERIGVKRSYFQELPEQSADDLLSRIVNVERYHAFFKPYRSDMRGFAEYFSVSKSNQVSVSYSTPDHLLDNVRRLYLLAPFLFLLTDNSAGFSQGKVLRGHSGMNLRHNGLKEGRGGVPSYVLTARSGEEYIAAHIDHVMNNPLYVYYDAEGKIVRVPAGEWTSFNALKDKGLNTATNYFFAQTVLWPDVKIAALRNSAGEVFGHRYEARMFGVGLHQHQTALLVVGALAKDDVLAQTVDGLLAAFGFDPENPEVARELLNQAYHAARNHDGKFFDIPYGTGTMREFAKKFADIIEPALDALGFEEEMIPLLTICRSGCTDGKVNRILFPELLDLLDYQKFYDPSVFENPNICGKILFEKDLSRMGASTAAAACCA